MKRNSIILFALALSACTLEPVNEEALVPDFRVESIHAYVPETRLSLDDAGFLAWSKGDDIAIHRSASGYETCPMTDDGCFNVHLAGTEVRDAFALYPARIADNAAASASNLKVILPTDYEIPTAGMAQSSPLPMIAQNDPGSEDLYFRQLGGILRLSLDNVPYETASLRVSMGKRITGSFSVSDPSGAAPSIATDTEADGPVTFTLAVPSSEVRNGYILNIPVPTGTYPSLSVTAHDFHDNLLALASDATERTFERTTGLRASLEMGIDVRSIPLCIKAFRTGVVTIKNPLRKTIEYSRDNASWTRSSETSIVLELEREEGIYLRGNNASYATGTGDANSTMISCSNYCYVYGNIMSLVDAENFPTAVELTSSNTFCNLFKGNTCIFNHPSLPLLLPATTLSSNCYYGMFYGCSKLQEAPSLPAMTLAAGCYQNMFYNCIGIQNPPALPATQLAPSCYHSMFYNCTSLQSAPDLPATTVFSNCYYNMFYGCRSLVTVPEELPAPALADRCYYGMFYGCSSLVTAPALPATDLATSCYWSMFVNCSKLLEAPELPATTLASGCYGNLFFGCTSLQAAPVLRATTMASQCYFWMFYNCRSIQTAPALPSTQLAPECYSSMFEGCNKLTAAPMLPATELQNKCYNAMFKNCSALLSAPVLPATVLAENCYQDMFNGCTGLTSAPDLPAEQLVSYCYYQMFNGCSSLNHVKAMFKTKPESIYTYNWLNGVKSTGTFVKNAAATWNVSGANGIPSGWTVTTATN